MRSWTEALDEEAVFKRRALLGVERDRVLPEGGGRPRPRCARPALIGVLDRAAQLAPVDVGVHRFVEEVLVDGCAHGPHGRASYARSRPGQPQSVPSVFPWPCVRARLRWTRSPDRPMASRPVERDNAPRKAACDTGPDAPRSFA